MKNLDRLPDLDRRNGDGAIPAARVSEYARLSAKIDRMHVHAVPWAADIAERMGLASHDLTVGELLAHCDKMHRANGVAGYLREDLLRREGRVPAELTVGLDLAGQYERLGGRIREALKRRGLNGEIVQAVAEAIREAVEAVEEGDGDDL